MSGTGPGQAVKGFIANAGSGFNPRNGYPTQNPSTGFSVKDSGFAGVIKGKMLPSGPTLNFYCIDINTSTSNGIGYEHGTWNEANVPNVGLVSRILAEYYPSVPAQPAGLTDNQRAAAVQAAVWFFTDRYVLNTADPLHDAVATIANRVIEQGPITQPPPPTLDISPSTARGPAGGTVGPFVVQSGTVAATLTSTGATMFADAAGTQPILDGATVPSGTFVWLSSATPGTATLNARAVATYPSGNVYLYDGHTPGTNAAQKLILSKQETVTVTVQAQAVFQAPGTLTVTKNITGAAAGSQGAVRIRVDCGAAVGTMPEFVIPGGARGSRSLDYPGLPADAVCTVTETVDGHSAAVAVTVTGSGQQVTIPQGESAQATITDTYTAVPGSVVVRKTITGPAAGNQDQVRIDVVCLDGVIREPFLVPAGQAAGIVTKTYPGIPGGTTCTVTETTNGDNQAVTVIVTGDNQQVTVPAGGTVTADALGDEYHHAPGSLTITKVIDGTAAAEHDPITITVTCDGVIQQPPLQIAAGVTGSVSQTYTGIPTPASCTVLEDPDGHTDLVAVTKAGDGQIVPVAPGAEATATLADTYTRVPGQLVVNKTITGGAAGSQGQVVITVACDDNVQRPDFVIAAGTAAGTSQAVYDGIANGTTCTVTEVEDGATAAVQVLSTGSPQDVVIPVDASGTANITDTYEFAPGQLTVAKTVTGPAAVDHGDIVVRVFCGGTELPAYTIPAGVTDPSPRAYPDIPAGTTCTAVETEDGRTPTVDVEVTGRLQRTTIPAGDTTTLTITDTYTARAGALVVRKRIEGEAAPSRGEIRVGVACDDGTARDPIVIPAGGGSGDVFQIYSQIPAGTTCTVTETADGNTDAVDVTVQGSGQTVSIPAGGAALVELTNTYTAAPGSLVIGKRITGPAAGDQGEIVLRPVCDGVPLPPFVIPAGTTAGTVTRTYPGLPAGAQCTGSEDPPDAGARVTAVTTLGQPLPLRIIPGTATQGALRNAYFDAAAAVTMHKTIRGPAAGQQDRIQVSLRCGDTDLPDFVIPAGSPAGDYTRTIPAVPPGARCSVTEPQNGSTVQIAVSTTGDTRFRAPVIGTQRVFVTNSISRPALPGAVAGTGATPGTSATPGTGALPDTGAPGTASALLPLGTITTLIGGMLIILAHHRRDTL